MLYAANSRHSINIWWMKEINICFVTYHYVLSLRMMCMCFRRMCVVFVGWNILYKTVRSIWPKLCFKSNVSFFIFHLDHLSIAESGVLKFSTIVVLSSSLFRSLSICLIYLVHQCRVYMYLRLLSFWWIDPLSLYNDLLLHFSLKVYFFWHKYSYSCSLLASTCMEYHFPSLHFQPMCGLKAVVSLLQAAYNWVFFF